VLFGQGIEVAASSVLGDKHVGSLLVARAPVLATKVLDGKEGAERVLVVVRQRPLFFEPSQDRCGSGLNLAQRVLDIINRRAIGALAAVEALAEADRLDRHD